MVAFISKLAVSGYQGIEKKHKAHRLKGEYNGYWEYHVKPDLLLVWDEYAEIMLSELVRTGNHSDLF